MAVWPRVAHYRCWQHWRNVPVEWLLLPLMPSLPIDLWVFCGGVFQFMLLQSLIAAVVVVDCGCHGG